MSTVDTIAPSRRSLWHSPFVKRFVQHRLAAFGFITIVFMALACALGPMLLPYSDTFIDIKQRFAAPFSGAHILGTDQMGRDILARLLMAGRISLSIGFMAMLVSMVIGICVGLLAGFYGGVVGAFTSWMEVARVVEAQTRSLRSRDYVMAAHSYGAMNKRIMLREILPNAIAPIVVAATLNVAHAILAESYISFLGFGIQPPTPSWGNMLNSAQSYLTSAPWLAIIPGLAITLAVTSFNFLGDGLRDALDPKINTQ